MFRVIHPNRWFFWTIAIIICVALYLVWSTKRAEIEFIENSFVYEAETSRSWHSETLGLSIRYPAGWQIEIDQGDEHSIFFENPKNYNENISISVRDPKFEAAIRSSFDNYMETEVAVDGEIGYWLKSTNSSDSSRNNVILVRHSGNLFYIAGSARTFKQILNSVRFL